MTKDNSIAQLGILAKQLYEARGPGTLRCEGGVEIHIRKPEEGLVSFVFSFNKHQLNAFLGAIVAFVLTHGKKEVSTVISEVLSRHGAITNPAEYQNDVFTMARDVAEVLGKNAPDLIERVIEESKTTGEKEAND